MCSLTFSVWSPQRVTVVALFQAVWALGNIAGDNAECRDYVLNCGILPSLKQWVCVCVSPMFSCLLHREIGHSVDIEVVFFPFQGYWPNPIVSPPPGTQCGPFLTSAGEKTHHQNFQRSVQSRLDCRSCELGCHCLRFFVTFRNWMAASW